MYSRNYNGHKTFLTDPTMLKGWQEVFETDSKEEVEEELRSTGQEFSWDKDHLKIVGRETAVETHSVNGKKTWFNHAAVREGEVGWGGGGVIIHRWIEAARNLDLEM